MLYEEYPDPETGELPSFPTINCETGEFELTGNFIMKTLQGKPFKIPREAVMAIDDSAEFERLVSLKKTTENKPDNNNNNTSGDDIRSPTDPKQRKPDLPPVFVIGHLMAYFTGVLKIVLEYCIQHKTAVIYNLINSDDYYGSMYKKFFRDVIPFLQIEATKVGMRQLKRKSGLIKYGLDYVKRVKIA